MARRRGPLFYFIWFLGVFLVGTVIVLSSITYYLSIDPSAYLSDDEVPILSGHERWNASDHGQVERIPRILHQTWRTEQLPPRWKGISQECRDMMPDYEYMLWTDESSRDFIAEHYPWFLDTFTDYTYAIQRADAIRYFILYHYGGVYLDLDIGCIRPLDPLLTYSVILPKTIPVGVSNDLMFAEPRHPFLAQTIHNLVTFDHSWILNYPTVMFSTGPMFLSLQYGLFTSSHAATPIDPIRILPKSLYGKNAKEGEAPHSFFSHFYGSSWHADDAAFIGFLGHWGKGLMWLGLIIMIIGIVRILLPGKQRRGLRSRGYEVLFPRWSSSTGRLHLHLGRSALLSDSDSSTRPPSPDSTMPSPSGSELYLPLDVPPSPSFRDWQSEQFAGRVSTPIVQAFRRVRNRVTSTITGHLEHELPEEPDTPIRPRRHGRGHSRGVLFFLPAIFAPTPDLEGGGASQPYGPPPDIPLLSRRPPEKYNPYEDGEEVLFDSNASETGTLVDHGGSSSRPHSRTAS